MFRCLQSRLPLCGSRVGVQTSFFRLCSSKVSKIIDDLIKQNKVVVFMKGTPQEPRCGFSSRAIAILQIHGVEFTHCNVLDDNVIRQGVKEFTKWPTIPQIFFEGVFIGGYDVLKQKHINGELINDLKNIGITSALEKDNLTKGSNKKDTVHKSK